MAWTCLKIFLHKYFFKLSELVRFSFLKVSKLCENEEYYSRVGWVQIEFLSNDQIKLKKLFYFYLRGEWDSNWNYWTESETGKCQHIPISLDLRSINLKKVWKNPFFV